MNAGTWRHFGFRVAALVTMGLAVLFAAWNVTTYSTPTVPSRLLGASFVIVPSCFGVIGLAPQYFQ